MRVSLRIFYQNKAPQFLCALIVLTQSLFSLRADAQDSTLDNANLPGLIEYAINHQPLVKQSFISRDITELEIKNRLADWYPHVNFNYVYQHNFQLPQNIIGGNVIRFGVGNTSGLQFTATQNIFNRDVLLASRTKEDVRTSATQAIEEEKILLVSNVSKTFYDLLASEQQRKVTEENIVVFARSLKDARARNDAGLTDKTDYLRATIALNNAEASKKEIEEGLKAKITTLKYLLNYPETEQLTLQYDSAVLENEIFLDTNKIPDFSGRIEYRRLETQMRLQQANIMYEKWSFLPTITANGAYLLNFQNDNIGKLYTASFPNSYAGLTIGVPIFQGGKRKNNISIANLQRDIVEQSMINFKNQARNEYASAMAIYKSSMAAYLALKENMQMAQEVHRIINLQYREGIKTYLELITAQTDLRTAQINYFNAVYNLLSSKIDVQKAEGSITVQ